MKNHIQIYTITNSKEEAEKIAQVLVDQKLAACVQISGKIKSIYRWKGKVEKTDEWMCSIKSEKRLYSDIEKAIKKLHSYETPEIIAVPIILGSREYLEWIDKELT